MTHERVIAILRIGMREHGPRMSLSRERAHIDRWLESPHLLDAEGWLNKAGVWRAEVAEELWDKGLRWASLAMLPRMKTEGLSQERCRARWRAQESSRLRSS